MTSSKMKVFVALLLLFISEGTCDPCDPAEYTILPNLFERYVSNIASASGPWIEDDFLLEDWYYTNGIEMFDSAPATLFRCGTKFPIWLDGSLPQTVDGVVTRTACTRTATSTCANSFNIQIKNCQDIYYVYYLYATMASSAYCFGENPPATPIMGHITHGTEVKISPTGIQYEELYFKCNFEQPETGQPNWFYKMYWYQDAVLLYASDYVDQTQLDLLWLTEPLFVNNGFKLGRMLSCEVELFFATDGSPGLISDQAPEAVFGIEVLTPELVFVSGEDDEALRTIKLRRNLPITCSGTTYCTIQVTISVPNTQGGIQCPSLAVAYTACHVDIPSTDPLETVVKIVLADAETGQYVELEGHYEVHLMVETLNSLIWNGYKLEPVNVRILPDPSVTQFYGSKCQSNNDPHMSTFDLRNYELQLSGGYAAGVYTLYLHEQLNAEVQMKVAPCSVGSSALCNCGVAVRFDINWFVFDLCPDIIPVGGYKLCGNTEALQVVPSGSKKYKVLLDYGTFVEVEALGMFLTIRVNPSKVDKSASKGLCGILDGDLNNDFHDKQGNVVSQQVFINEWRVTDGAKNMFLEDFNDGILMPTNFRLCTCSSQNPQGGVSCITNAVAECSSGRPVLAPECQILTRKRRSVDSNLVMQRSYSTMQRELPRIKRQAEQWNISTAETFCENEMNNCSIYALCQDVPNANPETYIEECVMDIMLTNGTEWTLRNIQTMRSACLAELFKNPSLWDSDNGSLSIAEQISLVACECVGCSGHGSCVSGACECDAGYIGPDCSMEADVIDIFGLENDGLCDVNVMPQCNNVFVHAFPVVDTDTLTCHLEEFVINFLGQIIYTVVHTVFATFNTLAEAICPLPELDTEALGMFGYGFIVSISNDGVTFSTGLDFIVYDSRCQMVVNIGGRRSLALKDGFCFIDGKCRFDGEISNSDSCMICDPLSSKWSWTVIPPCQGSKCTVRGDPHIKTYDKKKFIYGGTCPHYLLNGEGFQIPFDIIGDFDPCRRPEVSCLKSVKITIGGHTFLLSTKGKVYVDGNTTPESLPYVSPGNAVIYQPSRRKTVVFLITGISVYWDGKKKAVIWVPLAYFDTIYGMCGTYNNNQTDDFTKNDLTVTTNVVEFGDSWKTDDPACGGP